MRSHKHRFILSFFGSFFCWFVCLLVCSLVARPTVHSFARLFVRSFAYNRLLTFVEAVLFADEAAVHPQLALIAEPWRVRVLGRPRVSAGGKPGLGMVV